VDLRLDGEVAFVTGASKGIGRSVAEHLAREGSDVVIDATLERFGKMGYVRSVRAVIPHMELATRSIPFGRICEPAEVAALVTFLASPRASFINVAHIPVDGAQRKAVMDQ